MNKGELFQVSGVILGIIGIIIAYFNWQAAAILAILGTLLGFIGGQFSGHSLVETFNLLFRGIEESRTRKPAEWTPYKKVVSNGFPWLGKPMRVQIQLELHCDDNTVSLAARVAATESGGYQNSIGGAAGVVDQLIIEEGTYYVSVSNPGITWSSSILGWNDPDR